MKSIVRFSAGIEQVQLKKVFLKEIFGQEGHKLILLEMPI
jgi:hypothetical protein